MPPELRRSESCPSGRDPATQPEGASSRRACRRAAGCRRAHVLALNAQQGDGNRVAVQVTGVGTNGQSAPPGGHTMRLVRLSAVAVLAVFLLLLGSSAAAGATPSADPPHVHRPRRRRERSPRHRRHGLLPRQPQDPRRRHRPLGPEQQRDPHRHVPRRRPAACAHRPCEPSLGLPETPSPLVFNPTAVNQVPAVRRAGRHDHVRQLGPDGPRGRPVSLLRPHLHGRGHVPLPLPRARRDDVGHRDGRRRRTCASPLRAR